MDIISELSDELLIKILSLLPTKVAVSTRVLSKRWEYLWLWLPKLEFSSRYLGDSGLIRLQRFVDRNLPLHRAPVLETFRLELNRSQNISIDPANIKQWIELAISRRRVRELEIDYYTYPDKLNILPTDLYTYKSLVALKLDGGFLVDVPPTVLLPCLKTLHLRKMGYHDEGSLPLLLSSCPILEDLSVELHDDDPMRKLTFVFQSLQSLSLYIPYWYGIMDGIVIETPSLKYLKLKDHNASDHYCSIENMPNLIEAYLDVATPLNINSMIRSITSVKRLSICVGAVYGEGLVFSQLEYLEMCRCEEHSSDLLVRLLKDSSNLQALDLCLMEDHRTNVIVEWNQPSTVPECMLSTLQTINWYGYEGKEEEEDLAVYFLENALHLKTITFRLIESEVPEFEMIEELTLSSRASSTCQLIFI